MLNIFLTARVNKLIVGAGLPSNRYEPNNLGIGRKVARSAKLDWPLIVRSGAMRPTTPRRL